MSRYISVQQTAQQNRTRNVSFVTCDDYVTLTDGTGVVPTLHPVLVKTMPRLDVISMTSHSYS